MVEQEEVPLSYLPGGITRVRIRVIGDLPIVQNAANKAHSLHPEAENICWAGLQEVAGMQLRSCRGCWHWYPPIAYAIAHKFATVAARICAGIQQVQRLHACVFT